MSAAAFDPEWGDDWMAIVNATKETPLPHPDFAVKHVPHPSLGDEREEFTDLAMELRLLDWADELLAEVPIALIPTDHDVCHACADILCGCETQCVDLERDVCSHNGRQFCVGCARHHCPECRADEARWGRE